MEELSSSPGEHQLKQPQQANKCSALQRACRYSAAFGEGVGWAFSLARTWTNVAGATRVALPRLFLEA